MLKVNIIMISGKANPLNRHKANVQMLNRILLIFCTLTIANTLNSNASNYSRHDNETLGLGKAHLQTPKSLKVTTTKVHYSEADLTKSACLHLKLAEQNQESGNILQAINEYQKSISYKPSAYAYYGLGKLYFNENKLGFAKTNLQRALSLKPDSYKVLSLLGEIELQSNDLMSAHSHLCKALKLNPKDYQAGSNLVKLWKIQISQDPKNSNNYLGLAKTYQLMGNLKEAQANFKTVVKLDPNNPNLPQARENFKTCVLKYKAKKDLIAAHNLAKQGLYNEACNEATEAASFCPDDAGVKIYQATLYEEAKRYPEAYNIYLNSLKIDPNNNYALTRIKALHSQLSNSSNSNNVNPLGIISQANNIGNYANLYNPNAVNPYGVNSQAHINSLGQFFGALRNEGIARQLNFQDYEAKVHKSLTGRNSYYTATGQLGDLPVMPGTVKPQIPLPDLDADTNTANNSATTEETPVLDGGVSQNSYVGQALAELNYPQNGKLTGLKNLVGKQMPQMLNPTTSDGREKLKNIMIAASDIMGKSNGNSENKYVQALSDLTKSKKINESGQIVETPNKYVQAFSDITQKQSDSTGNKFANAFKDLTDNSNSYNAENNVQQNNLIRPVNEPNPIFQPNNSNIINNNQIPNYPQNNPNILNSPQIANLIQNNPNILNSPQIASLIQNNPNILNSPQIASLIQSTGNEINNNSISLVPPNGYNVVSSNLNTNLKGPINVSPETGFTNRIKSLNNIDNNARNAQNYISFNKTNASSMQFLLEGMHKTKTGVNLSVVFKNPTATSFALPKNTTALLQIPGKENKHLKVSFLDDIVPSNGEIHGVIKIPFTYCSPKANLYLEKIALSEGAQSQNLHLDLPIEAMSSMIATKKMFNQ